MGIEYENIKKMDYNSLTPAEYIYAVFFISLNKAEFFKKLFIKDINGIEMIGSKSLTMLL
jgi:hypothetical protein